MNKKITFNTIEEAYYFSGPNDENIKLLEDNFGIKVSIRGQDFIFDIPDDSVNAQKALEIVLNKAKDGEPVTKDFLTYLIRDLKSSPDLSLSDFKEEKIKIAKKGVPYIAPKTAGQRRYVAAIRRKDLVFCLGPAGTGKTYLSMAMAVEFFVKKKIQRIILTRPAVEAGEKIGFLPGSLEDKMNPYLRPLYDALYDMMEPEDIEEYIETGIIEVAPLAFMRGRTLNNAFIILDEAQNCSPEQMKMFLTRLGFGSKAVVTGDLTQSDLIGGIPIGLNQSIDVLKGIEGIEFVYLTKTDVVRHELVQAIIEAYAKYQKKAKSS